MSLRFVALGTILAACGFRITTEPGQVTEDATAGEDGALGDAMVTDQPAIDAPPPDAPAIDARICPMPPTGCVAFTCATSSSCYFVCSAAQTWTTAQNRCATAGGCLATINDAAEDACMAQSTLPAFPNIVWIGFKQTGSDEPAGGWGWQCGASTYMAPNWGAFEPNDDGNGEDCGALFTNGAWLDGGCSTQARYVCEIP